MKASPVQQKRLLELQQVDLQIGRLAHQEKTHPALQALAALRERSADLRRAVIAFDADRVDAERRADLVDAEVEKVTARRDLQQGRLNDGKVPMRDMNAMEHEIQSMERRISTLEDEQVELLEAAEELQEKSEAAARGAEAVQADEQKIEAELGDDLLVSQRELADLRTRRAELLDEIPEDVAGEYARLQTRLGPLVVIEMRGTRLIQAPVELPVAELSELTSFPEDELYVSDETEYLVARAGE